MSEQAENFAMEVEELFARRLKSFAEWVAINWKIESDENDIDLSPDQVEGWNRCCDGIAGAASVWLEEFDR